MKLNKSFLRIFLGLVMAFVFSFCVNAQNNSKEESYQKVKQLFEKLNITEEKIKDEPLGTKEGFDKAMKKELAILEKRIEELKLIKKKEDELYKKLDSDSTDPVFKEILSIIIKYFRKSLANENSNGHEKDNDEFNVRLKNVIYYSEYLKKKDKLSDEDKEYIKTKLREAFEGVLKDDIESDENFKEEFSKINYEGVKIWLRKAWLNRFMNKIKIPLLIGFALLVIVLLNLLIVKFVFMKSIKK